MVFNARSFFSDSDMPLQADGALQPGAPQPEAGQPEGETAHQPERRNRAPSDDRGETSNSTDPPIKRRKLVYLFPSEMFHH